MSEPTPTGPAESGDVPRSLDHLILGAPDLDSAVADLEARVGVRASPGGRHPAWGTRNALLALGRDAYLEILAPDPDQPRAEGPCLWGVDQLDGPRLVTWAARGEDLASLAQEASQGGLDLGDVLGGHRERRDGTTVSWIVTDPSRPRREGIVPFFIDWGHSRHPAEDAPGGCSLLRFRAEHPEPGAVRRELEMVDLKLNVRQGPAPSLVALLNTPRGLVELR